MKYCHDENVEKYRSDADRHVRVNLYAFLVVLVCMGVVAGYSLFKKTILIQQRNVTEAK